MAKIKTQKQFNVSDVENKNTETIQLFGMAKIITRKQFNCFGWHKKLHRNRHEISQVDVEPRSEIGRSFGRNLSNTIRSITE